MNRNIDDALRFREATEHRKISCWHCGHVSDMASGVGHDFKPTEGAAAFCIKCAQWSIYTGEGDTLDFRQPTDDELIELHKIPAVVRVEAAWQRMQEEVKAGRRSPELLKGSGTLKPYPDHVLNKMLGG